MPSEDSDSDEDFCLFGVKGPIIVCEEDEVQEPIISEVELSLTMLQHLELSFLRKDVQAINSMLEQYRLTTLQEKTVRMTLSLLRGQYVSLITSSEAVLPFDQLCTMCNTYESTTEVPEKIRKLAFGFIAGRGGGGGGEEQAGEAGWRAMQVLLLGCAHFFLFCQVNYTGPALQRDDARKLSVAARILCVHAIATSAITSEYTTESTTEQRSTVSSGLGQAVPQCSATPKAEEEEDIDLSALKNKTILRILECDGNYAFPLCELPLLLVLARSLLLAVACPLRAGWQAGKVNQQINCMMSTDQL